MNPERLLKHFDQISEAPDAVPRLRRFILDLAVRGKLVEQDTHAEHVANTYLKEPTSDHLPKNWRLLNFGKFCDIQGGNQPPKSQFIEEPQPGYVRLFQIRDLGESPVPIYIPLGTTNRFCREGEILIGRYGASIGKVFWAQDGAYNVALAKFIYPENAFLPKFAFLVLKSNFFQAKLTGATRSAQAGFNKGDLAEIDMPLPPLAEQHRIVEKVDELMALCDELEMAQQKRERRRDRLVAATLNGIGRDRSPNGPIRNGGFAETALTKFFISHSPRLTTRPEHIQQLRQTILNLAVRGKLVEQDPADEPASELLTRIDEWRAESIRKKIVRDPRRPLKKIDPCDTPYPLPDGWAWGRLGQVIYIRSGDGLTAENMKGGDIPVYGGNGVNGYHNAFNIMEPTIVIGRVGYYCGSVHVTPERAWVTDNAFITKFCSRQIFLKFLVLLLKGTNLKENENATAQPVISGTKIYPIVIGIPPRPEQYRIVAKVDELMALCDEVESRLNSTTIIHRQFLEATLQEALLGKHTIQEDSYDN